MASKIPRLIIILLLDFMYSCKAQQDAIVMVPISAIKRSPSNGHWDNILNSLIINRSNQLDLEQSARLMHKWSKARVGKRAMVRFVDDSDHTDAIPDLSVNPKRVEFDMWK